MRKRAEFADIGAEFELYANGGGRERLRDDNSCPVAPIPIIGALGLPRSGGSTADLRYKSSSQEKLQIRPWFRRRYCFRLS